MKVSEKRYIELGREHGLGLSMGTKSYGGWVTSFYKEYLEQGLVANDKTRESHPKWYAFVESLHMEEKLLMLEATIRGIDDQIE